MMKCIKDYRFHGATYVKGKEYPIKPEVAETHERYFGMELWAKTKSKSEEKREEIQKEGEKKAPVKKSTKKAKK